MLLSADNEKKRFTTWYPCILAQQPSSLAPSRFTRSAPTEPILGIFLRNFQATFQKYVSSDICFKESIL